MAGGEGSMFSCREQPLCQGHCLYSVWQSLSPELSPRGCHMCTMCSLPMASTRLSIRLFHRSQAQLPLTRELGQQLKETRVEWCLLLKQIRLSLIAEVIKQFPAWPSTHPYCFWPSCSATFLSEAYQTFWQVWMVICWVWWRTWASLLLTISLKWF